MKTSLLFFFVLLFFSASSVAYSQDEEASPVEKLQQQTDLLASAVEKLSKVKLDRKSVV